MERKTGTGNGLVCDYSAGDRRWGSENIGQPVIGSRMEVATGAGDFPITAGLCVPKERFTQHQQRRLVFHVDGEAVIGGTRLTVRVHPGALQIAVK